MFGADLNGRFGGLQGTGGLEAVILDATGTTTGVINDQFGNGVATVSGGTVTWNSTRVGAYGPLPGIQPQTLGDVTQLAAATAWRSRRIDPTGFYWLGARYYEPTSGRFLSADPMGHAASRSLYDFCLGDPLNSFDPLGMDTYFLNRNLNPKGYKTAYPISNNNILTHTFTYTTNPDGSLNHTYSWGNSYDSNGHGVWHKDAPEDVAAAQYAIDYNRWYESAPWWQQIFSESKYGIKVGDSDLDPFVDQAYQNKLDETGHPWELTDNCKDEASSLADNARKLQQQQTNKSCKSY